MEKAQEKFDPVRSSPCQRRGGSRWGRLTSNGVDVAVIGGGPTGIMAASRTAELGANVVLIEKNQNLGKKLLITGGGRCNISQAEFNDKKFVEKLGKKDNFFYTPLRASDG